MASEREWLRNKQFDEISAQFRASWDTYVKFYTVFLLVNFTALGLAIEHTQGRGKTIIIVTFVGQNFLALVTAVGMARYSRSAAQRMRLICCGAIADGPSGGDPEQLSEPVLPGGLGYWGGLANAAGHVLLIICWLAALSVGPSARP
ncbi:MAG: hypothetical protein IT349_09115 [Candidatus Eisenbacteria bacterium]|nr:hypothetical protein [Candidatus Eisenbacteria bacterium]